MVKHITVDMNELIDQISTKGLAIPYKCYSCGATITIDKDSKKDGLKFCSYCGTSYNIEDMTKIIQQALDCMVVFIPAGNAFSARYTNVIYRNGFKGNLPLEASIEQRYAHPGRSRR
jgi:DNA-directed RNA polymerase subunit RPC12/RpoP